MKSSKWNRKIFSLLLEQSKGVRSWRQFASDCDISYVQMRKLAQGTQENPPRPKLIHKIASKSFNEIDLEDLMFAAGINATDTLSIRPVSVPTSENFYEKYRSLSGKDRRTVNEFVDFLFSRREQQEESDDNSEE